MDNIYENVSENKSVNNDSINIEQNNIEDNLKTKRKEIKKEDDIHKEVHQVSTSNIQLLKPFTPYIDGHILFYNTDVYIEYECILDKKQLHFFVSILEDFINLDKPLHIVQVQKSGVFSRYIDLSKATLFMCLINEHLRQLLRETFYSNWTMQQISHDKYYVKDIEIYLEEHKTTIISYFKKWDSELKQCEPWTIALQLDNGNLQYISKSVGDIKLLLNKGLQLFRNEQYNVYLINLIAHRLH